MTNNQKKRLLVFFFYDKDGIVDGFIRYFLDDLTKNVTEMIVVCNGKLNADGRKRFEKYTDKIIVRENKGLDVWAYKTGLEYYGWDKLAEFDEVILANSTMMGPVYPFKETFDVMDQKDDLDFWGLTLYHGANYDPFGTNPFGYLPMHLQSHFIVYRQRFLKSLDLQLFWKNMKPINSYEDFMGLYEGYFTKAFEDRGFKWDVYADTRKIKDYTDYPLQKCPVKLLREYRCPIFNCSFFQPYGSLLCETAGQTTEDLYRYLRDETGYDVDLIWENALRTMHMEDLYNSLHLDYILPRNFAMNPKPSTSKIALVMHLYFMDILDESLSMARSMPKGTDIYITAHTEEKVKKIQEAAGKQLADYNVKVLQIENKGRDVSAILVGAVPYIKDYDYVCFFHDKKCNYVKPGTVGEAFKYTCYENILASKEYVKNVVDLFDNDHRLGLLVPPVPNSGSYFLNCVAMKAWSGAYDCTEKLAKKLELKAPISFDKRPIAPVGTVFWFRMDAMKKLFDYGWKYSDFPKEPSPVDGTIMHAVERIYPYVAQDAGYYSAVCMTDRYARNHVVNMEYYTTEMSREMVSMVPWQYNFLGTLSLQKYQWETGTHRGRKKRGNSNVWFLRRCRNFLQVHVPEPVFYFALRVKRFFLPSKAGYYDIEIPEKIKTKEAAMK